MLEYSSLLSERTLTTDDTKSHPNATYWALLEPVPEYTHVNVGDTVMKIVAERNNWDYFMDCPISILAENEGFVRYNGVNLNKRKQIGDTLFYITGNDKSKYENWDKSVLRIEAELLDGKYYYSILGIPKEPVDDRGNVSCGIHVLKNGPMWHIKCEFPIPFSSLAEYKRTNDHTNILLEKDELFNVKLENGQKGSLPGEKWNAYFHFEDEGNGEHLCLKHFAVGYPKKSQIRQDVQPTLAKINSEESCFVYIMRNNDNGAYKIGISKKPEYREHTLQSQEPNVTCIFQLEFNSREKARSVEHDMHIKYAEFHIRGEWFAIPLEQVGEVMADIVKYK